MLSGSSLLADNWTWKGDWNLDRARVTVGTDGDASDLLGGGVDEVRHLGYAGVSLFALNELGAHVVVLDGNDWPGDSSDHLLNNGLNPSLENGELSGDAIDGGQVWDIADSQVGLMKHVRVVIEAIEIAAGDGLLVGEEIIEGSISLRENNPFGMGAVLSITVVVDVCWPSWNDIQSRVAVARDVGCQRVHDILSISQERTAVVTNNICNTVIDPSLDGITVVETSDSRWNDTVWAELGGGCDTRLGEPGLVPLDLTGDIEVSSIVFGLVGECVGDVGEDVSVGGVGEPDLHFIQVQALSGVWVVRWSRWPQAVSGTEWLLELKTSNIITLVKVNGTNTTPWWIVVLVKVVSSDDVSITVVANLDKVRASWVLCGQLGVNGSSPRLGDVQISSCEAVGCRNW